MDNIINVKIRNRIATVASGDFIICGNEDYSIAFDFDDEWSGIPTKTARFYHNGRYEDHVFTGNTVAVPEFANITHVEVGVFAEEITTTPARIPCLKSILCRGGLVYEPPDDVYAEIIALINDLLEKGVTDEQIAAAVESYLEENPVAPGATAEQAVQIEQNTADILELKQTGGVSGEDGATFTPSVSDDGTLSWTNDKGLSNPAAVNIKGEKGDTGDRGEDGADGFSPTVDVAEITGGHRVTITDANGDNVFDVMDGADGTGGSGGGGGDMLKSVYDRDGNGVVDNAEKLGGNAPDYFARADHDHSEYAAAEHNHPEYAPAEHNHNEYLTEYTETDPTVPTWAKEAEKPKYTPSEIGLGNVVNERQYSKNNPPPYPVTSVNGQTGAVELEVSSISDVYSSEETLTNKIWIDGKSIYRKVFSVTVSQAETTIPTGISNFDTLTGLTGVLKGLSTARSIPYVESTGANSLVALFIGAFFNTETMELKVNSGSGHYTGATSLAYLVLEYTKK